MSGAIRTLTALALLCATSALAADWPMWRYDAGRTAASPGQLPGELRLAWVRQFTQREPVWDDPLNRDLMRFDNTFEPVVLGQTLFLGFNDADKLLALDTRTGEEKWTYYVDGPVRLPPVAWDGKVFFSSDDGCLYALDAGTGALLWRFQGAPTGRKVIGNKRLISTWPARGGPVVVDGIVYFAASIWPFMGTFIYALDAATGEVVWLNDGNGLQWMTQPHGAPSFAGVAPQGIFVAVGDKLLVPGGRSVPACFDRTSGRFLHYEHASNNKTGGAFVCAIGDVFFNHHREAMTNLYDVESGKSLARGIGRYPVLTADTYYTSGSAVTAIDAAALRAKPGDRNAWVQWTFPVDASADLIKAGDRLYAAGGGVVTALALGKAGAQPEVAWHKTVRGQVERLIAADGRLFAVTLDGAVMAFSEDADAPRYLAAPPPIADVTQAMTREAQALLDDTGVREGYALFYGPGDGELLTALLVNSSLHIVAVDPDPASVDNLRGRFDEMGLAGHRVAVLPGDPMSLDLAPYMASLTIIRDAGSARPDAAFLERIYHAMRPYGGVALYQPSKKADAKTLASVAEQSDLYGLKAELSGSTLKLRREGPLEGAASWTHYLGDIAQTGKSDDDRVRLPLGLLWFGGNSNLDVLTRHGHGPPELVIGGRCFLQGMTSVSARDVYTGRVIWKKEMHDLGTYDVYYDGTYKDTPTSTRYNQVHIPGANIRGANYAATEDSLYVIQGSSAHVLDTATGAARAVFRLPAIDPDERRKKYPPWGYIGIYEDTLFAGAGFVAFSDLLPKKKADYSKWEDYDKSASKRMIAMDRHTGEIRWEIESMHGFLHNGVAVGNGTMFVLDKLPPHLEKQLARRGEKPDEPFRLLAIDVESGKVKWSTEDDVFGSFLSYSEEHDILIQSTRASRDTVAGENGTRMIAYRGRKGKVLWAERRPYPTFPLLHGENFISEAGVFSLLTGKQTLVSDPLTGVQRPWVWERNYGCNYPIASEHLLTFRSGAAGFFDLASDGGTGSFGGFKSSCTANLVAADGVLNAPDYTRTCSCSYQNQTSLAFVHMPELETWTFNNFTLGEERIRRVGINLGAPGDRRGDAGTLWLEYPVAGGPSPGVGIAVEPENPEWFRHHSLRMKGGGLDWVGASGATGLNAISISLAPESDREHPYTVRLYFAEWGGAKPGERVFDVSLQGKPVLSGFDPVDEAGGGMRTIVKEFKGIPVKNVLRVALSAPSGADGNKPVLCGVEAVAE
ncbi:MAG: PQQ-binding-like beta-propeller repeat protein [Nitrospiraceae bacterium]|nr:PQQ-binding-like beta-propeller repeat protein [Nitrospiraceae bacterium]